MKVCRKLVVLLLIIFAFSSLTYAGEVSKSEKKGKMPASSDSTGDAKDSVKSKNDIQDAEDEQSEKEDGDKKDKKEDDENKSSEDGKQTLKIQGSAEDSQQIKAWLENLLGRALDLNNSKDKAVYDFWYGLLDKGYTLEQVGDLIDTVGLAKKTIDFWYHSSFFQMGKVDLDDISDIQALFNWANLINQGFTSQDVRLLIIVSRVYMQEIKDSMIHRNLDVRNARDVKIIAGWCLYRKDGYSAQQIYNLFKTRLIPKVKKLLGKFDAGFFTYFTEEALAGLNGGLDYTYNLLDAMAEIKTSVESLIGKVDLLDNAYEDNGFLTYWAQQTMDKGTDYIKQHLYIWKQLLPYIEEAEGRKLDLFNPDDGGILDYWAQEVEKKIDEGMNLENALQNIVQLIQNGGGEGLTSTQEALIPYVETLIGTSFNQDDSQQMGFLSYWAERADKEGLGNIQNLLSAMADIKPNVEALIGNIDLFDKNDPGNGFLTYWAEKALSDGVANTKALLSAMADIKPNVETLIGNIDLFDKNDPGNGFLTYWAEQALAKGADNINQTLYIWKQLIPTIEQFEGKTLDLFNPDDSGMVSYWAGEVKTRVDGDMSLENAIAEVIQLILNPGGVLTSTQEALIPYIEALIGTSFNQDDSQQMGFLSYWAERADKEGLQDIKDLLDAMANIKSSVEALIGNINLFDENDAGNGFLTYWAEQALANGTADIQILLSNMAAIKPSLETLVGSIDLLDNSYDDNGLLTFWAQYAQDFGLQYTINIINNMAQIKDEVEALIGPVDLYDSQYGDNGFLTYWAEYAIDVGVNTVETLLSNMAAILPEVEAVIGTVDLFDGNYNDNGFLSYWAEYSVANGVQNTKNILSNMHAILNSDWDNNGTSEIEELIGAVDLFDNNYDDNGFLTYWAQQAVSGGVEEVEKGLYIWKRLLPYVETYEGKTLNLFDPNDSGILSFWTNEILKLMSGNNLGLEEAIQEIIAKLNESKALASFLYTAADKISSFFQEGIGINVETGLPYSWITSTKDGKIYQPDYTSISDIGGYITSLVSLYNLDKLTEQEFDAVLTQIITSLYSLPHYSPDSGEFQGKMYFFNYYDLPSKNVTINNFISSIDNTNLVMALILARKASSSLAGDLNTLINKIDLGFFYDNTSHLFYGGYDFNPANGEVSPSAYHYGMLNTETRLISYLAAGKGDISNTEVLLNWQTLARNKINVDGIDIVASYGGSLFEFLFPSLFIDEAQLSPNGFGLNFKKAVLLQKLQAIKNGYPFWGEAPCYNDVYEYGEFGSPAGINPYPSEGILSPYTVFLSLNATGVGGDLLSLLESMYPGSIQSNTGLIDAIDVNNDTGIYLNSTLLQGITLATIANNLNNSIRGLFAGSAEYANIANLIQNETFFTDSEINTEMDNVHDLITNDIAQNKWQEAKAYFDYFKDLVITRNQQAKFPDLNQLETQVNQLLNQNLAILYQLGQTQLNNSQFPAAITTFQKILYYDAEYQNAQALLTQARSLRNAAVVIPNLSYVVTTFEEGTRPNSIVRKIGPVDGPNGNIDIGIVKDSPEHGKAMKLKYELQPGGYNGMYINTDNLALVNTNKLAFDIKGGSATGIPDKIKIELHFKGSTWPYPAIEIDNITGDWQHIEISLQDLLPLLPANFELEQIAVIFEGDNVGNNQGAVYIDNIGFD